jgi:hypothetical protein
VLPKKPAVPPGASYKPDRLDVDAPREVVDEAPAGAEFPQIPGARKSSVVDGDEPGTPILDDGEDRSAGPERPRTPAATAPDPADDPEG